MNCEYVKERLVEYLLNELSEEERLVVEMHLRQDCSSCIALEQEIASGIDVLFDSLPNEPFSSRQREDILVTAIGKPEEQVLLPISYPSMTSDGSPWWSRILPSVLAMAAGVLVMMVVAPLRTVTKKPMTTVNVDAKSGTFAVDPTSITQDSEIAEEKYSRSVLVSMQRTNDASKIEGRVLWDALSHEVHFFGKGIPKPPNGMRYVLWLIGNDDQMLVSKELKVDSEGLCKATAAASKGDIHQIYITLESLVSQFDRPSNHVELTLDAKQFNAGRL